MQAGTVTRWAAAGAAAAAALALVAAGPWTGAATAQDPGPAKIGFVNVKKVLHDYAKTESENKGIGLQS